MGMHMIRTFLRRLRYLLHWSRFNSELAEEMDFHRAMKEAELQNGGASPADAQVQARRALGPMLMAREDARAVWFATWLESAWSDIRYACRGLRRSPTFTIGVVATLAISIGANAAMFALVDATLIHPLRIHDAERLVRFVTRSPADDSQVKGLR